VRRAIVHVRFGKRVDWTTHFFDPAALRITLHMASHNALTLHDISWLRQASHKAGALEVPSTVASRLISGGLVERDLQRDCLTITKRGELALNRLG
jgi:hypothetical protein